ncbi:MAG: iron-containing alcohol dehydrogenase family protein [Clostridia bacterium]|nr:iron-containing alcohol dehydrogenase family protein [Clostridia bacterium]
MKDYSISLCAYTIGENAYGKISQICSAYGKSAVIIGGNLSRNAAESKLINNCGEINIIASVYFGGEASEKNINTLCHTKEVIDADMIFAVGGGKALDTCKAVAHVLGKPVFSFPTIASTCAATTAVSILYTDDGAFLRPCFLPSPPIHAFIDTSIIAASPQKYMWAGIGDTLAKYYEAGMSSDGEILPHYFALGVEVSRMCAEPVYLYGKKALEDNKAKRTSFELEQIVLAIVVSTGIASILLTAEHTVDYNSGLAHAIFYTLTKYEQIEKNHLHGEVVGFGILLLLLVWQKYDEFERLYSFMRSVGLPTYPEDIELTENEIASVIPSAAAMPDVRHSSYPVTEKALEEAFKKLCEYNK